MKESELKVVVARATSSPDRISGAATCLFNHVPVGLYGNIGFLFYSNVNIEMTMQNSVSSSYGYNPTNPDGLEHVPVFDQSAINQESITPLVALGEYLNRMTIGKKKFPHNETVINQEPFAVFISDNTNFQSVYNLRLNCVNKKMPILRYDSGLGEFCVLNEQNNLWEHYKFSDNILSARNKNHCQLANSKYEEHCDVLRKKNHQHEQRNHSYSSPPAYYRSSYNSSDVSVTPPYVSPFTTSSIPENTPDYLSLDGHEKTSVALPVVTPVATRNVGTRESNSPETNIQKPSLIQKLVCCFKGNGGGRGEREKSKSQDESKTSAASREHNPWSDHYE